MTLAAIRQRTEAALYRRGFASAEVRSLVGLQLLIALVSALGAVIASGFSNWGLSYGAGAVLVTMNFYQLALFVQQAVQARHGAVASLLLRFYGRLIVTGVVLYGLIVWAGANVAALVAGLSTVVATALYFGVRRIMGKNVKEA
jgi:hypothetical protein